MYVSRTGVRMVISCFRPRVIRSGMELPETGAGHGSVGAPWLHELLETLDEFGTASLALIAWELSLSEDALHSARGQAMSQGLIEVADRAPDTGEELYRLP